MPEGSKKGAIGEDEGILGEAEEDRCYRIEGVVKTPTGQEIPHDSEDREDHSGSDQRCLLTWVPLTGLVIHGSSNRV